MRRSSAFLPWLVLLLIVGVAPLAAQLTTGEGILTTTAWVSAHLRDPELVILQVGPRDAYDREHIPGARFVELKDIAAGVPNDGGLALEMPEPADLRTRLEALGISDGSRIVVVPAEEWLTPAARVLFTLGYAGLSSRATFLDGGLAAWKRAGLPVTTEVAAVAPGHLTTAALPSLVVDFAYMQTHAGVPKVRLVDGRSPVFFQGPGMRRGAHPTPAGHIAGAVNIPFDAVFDDSSLVLPRRALETLFRTAGIQPGDTVVAYCHVGQQATAVLMAARLLGHPVRLYDGSMDDWTRRSLALVGGQP